MKCILFLLVFLPSSQEKLHAVVTAKPLPRAGFSTAFRPGNWFDNLQDYAARRGANIYRDGVAPLLVER